MSDTREHRTGLGRYLSVAGGIAQRLLGKLASNPALFLPPMLMPLFFFVAPIYVAHGLAVLTASAQGGSAAFLLANHGITPTTTYPEWYGFRLPGVYAMWLAVVAMLYPMCRWFAAVKARRRAWWLSYL